MTRFSPLGFSVLYSPAWFLPFDEFAQRVRSTGVSAELDRFEDGVWVPEDVAAVRTPSAVIAYPGLGRRAAGPTRYRARFTAPGYLPLYPADGEPFSADVAGVEFLACPYDDTTPPAAPAGPRLVRLLPGGSFPYPPGVRTVHGTVLDGGRPVANALVEARGTTSRDGVGWQERTLSDARGAFRLSLRWEGEPTGGADQSFHLLATGAPGRTGSRDVRLPSQLTQHQVIDVSPQQ